MCSQMANLGPNSSSGFKLKKFSKNIILIPQYKMTMT